MILMPFYLQNILLLSPRDAGILMGVVPLVVGIVAPISGNISDRIGPRPLTAIGLFILIFGFVSVSKLDASTTAAGYALHFLPVGLGLGLFQSPNNSAIMGTAPKNRLGIVSGMLAITRTLGQISGISILGAVWASRVGFYIGSGNGNVDATQAPVPAQIAGLHDTIYLVAGLLIFAFLLSLWALYQVIGKRSAAQPQINRAVD